ncbi:MAG: SusC/RagA family TonB-linked outer membrane protein [Gemmatimonadota bacterium]|nr:SusC/RagA family TonB-linked outer membrane protein [Gemmatimonadota bacterium]
MTKPLRSPSFLVAALVALIVGIPALAQSQSAIITGRVISDQGQPLAAANVFVPELNISVATNQSGAFTITVPAARVRGQSLVIRARAIGYQPASNPVTLNAGSQSVDFNLKKDLTELSAVVVTGVTKATEAIKLPFTVTRVDTSQMPVSGSNPLTQLQGKIPGALIVNASGRPGASPSIVLRGPVSLNATGRTQQPLYLLDGVPLSGGLPDINPNDIEDVEVVKGAAAASLYGARAGAGVINITTKSGKNAPEGVRFGVRTELGTSNIERAFPLATRTALAMDPTGQLFCTTEVVGGSPCGRLIDWDAEVQRINNSGEDFSLPPQKFLHDFGIGLAPNYAALTGYFLTTQWPHMRDPVGQVVSPSRYANTNLDMRGKVGNTGVYASLSNFVQEGAIKFLPGFTRNAARVNVDQRFGDKISANVNSYYSQTLDHAANFDETSGTAGTWFSLTRAPWMSDMLAVDNLGRIVVRQNPLDQGTQNFNPLYSTAFYKRSDRGTRFVGGTSLRYTPLDWLNLETNLGYDRSTAYTLQMRDKGWRVTASAPSTSGGFIQNGGLDNETFTGSISGSATRTFFNDLNATLSSRYIYSDQTLRADSLSGTDIIIGGLETADAATKNFSVSSGSQTIRDLGFFTGVDFDYKDRYILGGLIRRDGSSLFGSGNRWQTFGRGSAAWIASREPWWPAADALSLFKVRASLGTTGQRPRFNAQYGTYTLGVGGTFNPANLGNPNLRPEINRELELGGDFEFFRRIGLNLSYAKAVIDGQILPVKQPTATGFSSQWINAGVITNKTWEATLSVPIIQRENFNWSSRVIYDRTRSILSRLDVPEFVGTITPGPTNAFDIFKFRTGEEIGTIYGFDYVRRCDQLPAPFSADCGGANSSFRVNDQGFIVWVGQGNQLTEGITRNLWTTNLPQGSGPWGNRTNWGMPITLRDSTNNIATVPVGNGLPRYHWGLSQNLDFKKFNVYALLDSYRGQKLWNIAYHWSLGDFQSKEIDQAGKSVETAKPIGYYWRRGPSNSPGGSSGIGGLYDALGPSTFSVEDASYVKLRELSVSYRVGALAGTGDWKLGFVGRNLHTWTKYRGFDPESGNTTGPLNSSALTPVAGYRFPNLRTYTVQLSTSF